MIDFLEGTGFGSRLMPVALDLATKATVLVVVAFAGHAMLGRRRAAARAALWDACLIGLLGLPMVGLLAPRVTLVVPSPTSEEPVAAPVAMRSGPIAGPMPVGAAGSPGAGTTAGMSPPGQHEPRISLTEIGCGLYLATAAVLALRLAGSLAAIAMMRSRALAVTEDRWLEAMVRWHSRLGVGREVALIASEDVSIPVAVGWLRPAVLLPDGLLATATPAVIEAVVLHELAHVRRRDFVRNLIHNLVRVVYWPHPLVWAAGRPLGEAREQACDDLCVHALGGVSYGEALLHVASGLVRRPGAALGMAMARGTNLGRRLHWIDRTAGAAFCHCRGPARLGLSLGAGFATIALASIQVSLAERPAPQTPAATATRATPGRSESIEILVRAQDSGKPLANARVRAFIDMTHVLFHTDGEGRVRIDLSSRRFRDSLSLDVWADGYVQQRHDFFELDARVRKRPDRLVVDLLPGEETLGGTVVDEQGTPIRDVKVEIWGHLGATKRKEEGAFKVDATTDAQGRWRCRSFRSMKFAYLYLSHPHFLSDGSSHPRPHGQPVAWQPALPGTKPMEGLRDFSDVQVMKLGVEVGGVVQDQHGRPISGAEVGWLEAGNGGLFHRDMVATTTDVRGRYRFPHVPPGKLVLQVQARGHAPELKEIDARELTSRVPITLGPAHTIEGHVKDTQGRPIPDAFVVVDTWRASRAMGVYLGTDAAGHFRWDDAPADPIRLNVTKIGFVSANMVPASPGAEVRVALPRSLSISGRVRDVKTNKTIEGDSVHTEVGFPDPKTGAYTWFESPSSFVYQGVLQAEINVERASEFRLRFRVEGYEPHESRPFRPDEGQVTYDVSLTPTSKP